MCDARGSNDECVDARRDAGIGVHEDVVFNCGTGLVRIMRKIAYLVPVNVESEICERRRQPVFDRVGDKKVHIDRTAREIGRD